MALVESGCRLTALYDHGYLYIYTYSGHNAWGFSHHAAISRWKHREGAALRTRMAALSRYLKDYELPIASALFPQADGALTVALVPGEGSAGPPSVPHLPLDT